MRENQFIANTLFPIYLKGSATLEFYEAERDHGRPSPRKDPSIGLGGYFGIQFGSELYCITQDLRGT